MKKPDRLAGLFDFDLAYLPLSLVLMEASPVTAAPGRICAYFATIAVVLCPSTARSCISVALFCAK
jgi:hypothetical protein